MKYNWRERLILMDEKLENSKDIIIQYYFKQKNDFSFNIRCNNYNYTYTKINSLVQKKVDELNLIQDHKLRMLLLRHARSVYFYLQRILLNIYSFEKRMQNFINKIYEKRNNLLKEIDCLNLNEKIYTIEDKLFIKKAKNGLKKFGKFKKFKFKDYGIAIKLCLYRLFTNDIANEIISFI